MTDNNERQREKEGAREEMIFLKNCQSCFSVAALESTFHCMLIHAAVIGPAWGAAARPLMWGDPAVNRRAEVTESETHLGYWRRRVPSSSANSACYWVGVCDHACVCAHIFLSATCHVHACSLVCECVCSYGGVMCVGSRVGVALQWAGNPRTSSWGFSLSTLTCQY